MCVPGQQPAVPSPGAPGSAGEAVGMALAGLGWLATADVVSVPAVVLADALRGLEQVVGLHTAARSRVLSAFTAQAGANPNASPGPEPSLGTDAGAAGASAGVSRAELRELLLSHAVALLSGPGGLASVLRTGTLPRPAGSVSLPLDIGTATDTIPPHLRRAVIARDKHCAAHHHRDQPSTAPARVRTL
jgi:hypothetical protein